MPPKLTGPDDTFTSDPDNPKVVINNTVTLTCPVSRETDPQPVLTWYKDNVPMQEHDLGSRVFVTDSGFSLTITEAQLGDEARYRCIASNVAGEVHKDFNLEVQGWQFNLLCACAPCALLSLFVFKASLTLSSSAVHAKYTPGNQLLEGLTSV